MNDIGSLAERCQHYLCADGPLASKITGFTPREQQIELAQAIAASISSKSQLVVEAGTGTGKTFAYLVPSLLSGEKVIVSTATKTLQDQLFQKDLPLLLGTLGVSLRIQNLKGRANYICRYRTQLHAQEGRLTQASCAGEVAYVNASMARLKDGERHELPDVQEDSMVWPYVTSNADNCLGKECPYHQSCFLMKARKRAMEADVVVINHHLFFADSRLKEDGLGDLLPGAGTIVFDEAHQLAEIAAQFHGDRFSTRQCRDLMDDVLREWPVLERPQQLLQTLSLQLNHVIANVLSAYTLSASRASWSQVMAQSAFRRAWEDFIAFFVALEPCFSGIDPQEHPGLERCRQRFLSVYALAQGFNQPNNEQIRWVESFKQTFVFHATPLNIQEAFQALLSRHVAAYIFTSATLTVAGEFDCFIKSLGLNDAKTLCLPSPFDFKQQALLYLPRGLPDPQHASYYDCLLTQVMPVINACGGRCFFLFTSHRALQYVASTLSHHLTYPMLVQGQEAKPILLARFRALGNAVLLGTSTFWEGVDVKGEALSCVIIDKLPFASPADPVMSARMSYVKSQGLSAFDEISLPNAVLALKQGVGRLIRDVDDQGVLMIADPRLTGREYGRQIFASLPPMRKTREEKTVLEFIASMGLRVLETQ